MFAWLHILGWVLQARAEEEKDNLQVYQLKQKESELNEQRASIQQKKSYHEAQVFCAWWVSLLTQSGVEA